MRSHRMQILFFALALISVIAQAGDTAAVSLYPSTIMSDNPVAYFPLDESTGSGTVTDVIGARTGTVFAGTTLGVAPGPLAYSSSTAATFNGASGKIDVAFDPTLNTPAFTIETWARVTGGAGSYRSPVTSRAGGPAGYLFYATPANEWEYWTGGAWTVVNGGAYSPADWTHLVGTYDGTNMRFYINGIQAGPTTPSTYLVNSTNPFRIGAGATEGSGTYFFNGDVAEVAYYNTALSAERILAHYDAAFLELTVAPEPTSATLLGVGMLGLSVLRRRRNQAARNIGGATCDNHVAAK